MLGRKLIHAHIADGENSGEKSKDLSAALLAANRGRDANGSFSLTRKGDCGIISTMISMRLWKAIVRQRERQTRKMAERQKEKTGA